MGMAEGAWHASAEQTKPVTRTTGVKPTILMWPLTLSTREGAPVKKDGRSWLSKRRGQSTSRDKRNKNPAVDTKRCELAEDACKPKVAYANAWEQPNHPHNSYIVEVSRSAKADGNPSNRRWTTGKRPDVQCLSEQCDEPKTFWRCSFRLEDLGTLVALTAHVNKMHLDKIILYDCGTCDFRTEGLTLLQDQRARVHNMGTKPARSAAVHNSR